MNTIGFKKQRAEFQDLLYENLSRQGAQSSDSGTVVPTGVQVGSGVKTGTVTRMTAQGALSNTGNKYDIAINGKGYFQVLLPSGDTAYTRAGNFSPNDQGQLVTVDGYLVQPQITIPQGTTDVTISKTGQVQATIAGQTQPQVIGPAAAGHLLQRGGAGGDRRQLLPPVGRLGPAERRHAGDAGLRLAAARLHRGLQRRSGERDHRPDRGPSAPTR